MKRFSEETKKRKEYRTMANGKKRTYLRDVGKVATLRITYERLATEKAQELYNNLHSQHAYQKGFLDAVDMYVKPKKRSEERAADDSMLQDINY